MNFTVEEKLYHYDEPFELEGGSVLPRIKLQYTTYGRLNAKKDNVIWVCHALTADANAKDWWEGLVGLSLIHI